MNAKVFSHLIQFHNRSVPRKSSYHFFGEKFPIKFAGFPTPGHEERARTNVSLRACMCVCVRAGECVCERESVRVREREIAWQHLLTNILPYRTENKPVTFGQCNIAAL
jgi:hypothetical protein